MKSDDIENNYKVYVQVDAHFDADGSVTPLSVIWEDGRRYEIDRVLDSRRAPSLKAGGLGIRYTVKIRGRQTYLFYEGPKWFMERR